MLVLEPDDHDRSIDTRVTARQNTHKSDDGSGQITSDSLISISAGELISSAK